MRPLQTLGSRSRHHALIFRGITPDFFVITSSRRFFLNDAITPIFSQSHHHAKKRPVKPSHHPLGPSHHHTVIFGPIITPIKSSNHQEIIFGQLRHQAITPDCFVITPSHRFYLITQSGPFICNPLGDSRQGRLVFKQNVHLT